MIKTNYNKWLTNDKVPQYLKDELLNMNEVEIEESFYRDLEFGTGGLRGILGAGTNKMNIFVVQKATLGLALYLRNLHGKEKEIKVAMASDSRHYSKEFMTESARVLATYNIKTIMFDDIRPTPMLSFLVREEKCDAGIMITASHNPKEYNGYKVYDSTGAQLNLEAAEQLLGVMSTIEDIFSYNFIEDTAKYITYIGEDYDEYYISKLEGIVDTTINFDDIKIVFSPEHGTGYKIVPKALKANGFNNVIEVVEQMTPDGDFPNTKSSNPEEIEAYELAIEYMKKTSADIAIVNDPDADRLGIVVRDKDGNIIPFSGNQTGTLMINYLVNKINLKGNEVIYKTIVTGEMGANIAKEKGISVKETLTGFKFIGEQIKLIEENNINENYIFGYEESYGYLLKSVVRDKDAVQASLFICELVAYYKQQGKTLVDVMQELYEEYGYYSEITHAISLKGMEGLEKIKAGMNYVRVNEIKQIGGMEVSSKIDYLNMETGLPKTDVVKFYLKDTGWVVFRPSGTEPKLKIYVSVIGDTLKEADILNKAIYDELILKLNI